MTKKQKNIIINKLQISENKQDNSIAVIAHGIIKDLKNQKKTSFYAYGMLTEGKEKAINNFFSDINNFFSELESGIIRGEYQLSV